MKCKNFAVMAGIAVMCMAVAPAASVFAEQATTEASGMEMQGGPEGMQNGFQGGPEGMQNGFQGAPGGMEEGQFPGNGGMPMDGQGPTDGEMLEGMPCMIDFDAMVEEGIISEETREKIQSYMEEHRPDGEAPGMNGEAPEMNGEKPEDAPELPEGEAPAMNGERPEGMPGMNGGLLNDLLNDGIITQSEYDAMTAAQGTTVQTGTEEELA